MDDTTASVFSDHVCQLGEGPTYDPATDTAYWFDIRGKTLLSKRWPDGETVVQALPEMASALAVIDEGRHALFTETGLHLRDVQTGTLDLLQPIEADNALTRSNDARVHPSGAFWLGTMGKGTQVGAGSIYWYREGELRRLYSGITIPNSICFSPDGTVAYFADTHLNRLMHVACDPQTGLPLREPAVFLDHAGIAGGIDGSVTDAEGLIWNARWGSGAVDCYHPDGRRLRRIDIPARQSSCPAFIGPAADRMIVTSAWQDMDDVERQTDRLAGQTFLVDLPIRGRHDPRLAI